MKALPKGLKAYGKTKLFNAETIPPALKRDHATKPGVWGLIHVISGELVYRVNEAGKEYRLRKNDTGTIEPEILHSVKANGDVTFYVEFWRRNDDG